MGKICAVPGCDSGIGKTIKQRKSLQLRRVSLFSVPKNEDRRRQWKNALSCELDINQFVCEFHFSDDVLKKCERTVMPDGSIHEWPLVRWRLEQNAVPKSEQRVPMDCKDNNNEEGEITQHEYAVAPEEQQSDPIVLNEARRASPCPLIEPLLEKALEDSETIETFTVDSLKDELSGGLLPESWAWTLNSSGVTFTLLDRVDFHPQLHLEVAPDLKLQVRTIADTVMQLDDRATSTVDVLCHLKILNRALVCEGTGMKGKSRHPRCIGMSYPEENGDNYRRLWRCKTCQRLRKTLQRREQRRGEFALQRHRAKKKAELARKKFKRLQRKTKKVLADVADLKQGCSKIQKNILEENISCLPAIQQQAVRTCFETAKLKNQSGRRYAIDWIYECLLMRIKNSGLYEHIRERQILPLPCRVTLSRYVQRISTSTYGFQSTIFEGMKTKGSHMDSSEKRGTLLADEMKLSEAISFNKQTLQFGGFVDLGEHTPEAKKNTRADHALVFMFQPFRGSWVQYLGCFLTKESVTSTILHKLILECIVLLGNAGYHVDVVTTDGAQWNRGVWNIFGIHDGKLSCEHPCHRNKRLWMISDFPHLIKCFRNGVVGRGSFQTPDGIVQKKHWEALLKYEQFVKPNLKVAYKLTPTHLNPIGYQKMNVPLAFQLFSLPVQVAMEIYRKKPEFPELSDSEATQKLCERTDKLIGAMMSRTPVEALRNSEDCPHRKAIIEFVAYLREWESIRKSKEMPISASTINGLKVTLGGTLEIFEALQKEDNFKFLMTARLNQDALERFFGIVRGRLGGNDHPDPETFLRLARLLSSYSLIKPPRNSNVSGTELLEVLMQSKDSLSEARKPRTEWLQKLDRLLEEGHVEDAPMESYEHDHNYKLTFSMSTWKDSVQDHTYDVTRTSSEVQAYLAGFVVRKMLKQVKCQDCLQTLQSNSCEPDELRDAMIDLMEQYGGLLRPSDDLFRLTEVMETTVLDVVGKFGIKIDTLHIVVERLAEVKDFPKVGCVEHRQETTRKIVDFYIVMRGHFLAKSFNANNNEARTKTKRLRKNAKL